MQLAAKPSSLDVNCLRDEFHDHFDARKDIESVQLAGDASTRKYFRVTQGKNSKILQQADAFLTSDADKHPYISAGRLMLTLGVQVPKILASHPAKGWILMEDLGDKTLSQEPTLDRYKIAIDWIVKMISGVADGISQNKFHQYQGPHLKWAFDFEKLDFEMRHTATHLVEGYLKENSSRFLTLIEANTVYLSKRPRFFCHRDYHSRNLMLHNNSVFVIDFQDARMGPITYDIVSLLWDPYLELPDTERESLLDYWLKTLQRYSNSKNPGAKTVKDLLTDKTKNVFSWKVELERMKLQRLLKAAGSYASFLNLKGRKDYLPWIRPALDRSVESLEKLRDFHMLDSHEAELLTLLPQYLAKLEKL